MALSERSLELLQYFFQWCANSEVLQSRGQGVLIERRLSTGQVLGYGLRWGGPCEVVVYISYSSVITRKPRLSQQAQLVALFLIAQVHGERGSSVQMQKKNLFLQGHSVCDQEPHSEPVAEPSQALDLENNQCMNLCKSVCGLIDAHRVRWDRVEKDENGEDWRTMATEPCFCVKISSHGRAGAGTCSSQ